MHLQELLAQQGSPLALAIPIPRIADAHAVPALLHLPPLLCSGASLAPCKCTTFPFVTACPVLDAPCSSAPLAAAHLPSSINSTLKSITISAAQVHQLPLPGAAVSLLCSTCPTHRFMAGSELSQPPQLLCRCTSSLCRSVWPLRSRRCHCLRPPGWTSRSCCPRHRCGSPWLLV